MKLCRYIPMILLTVLSGAGCSSDRPETIGSKGACELVVTLETGIPVSRADADGLWGESYPSDPGSGFESSVDKLALYFVTEKNTVISLVPLPNGCKDGIYEYRTTVNVNADYVDNDGNGNYSLSGRIVALANYPGENPSDPFVIPPFDINVIRTQKLIPMWGVTTISALPLKVNSSSDAGSISLLRAVPKLTVMLDAETASVFRIKEVHPDDSAYPMFANCQPSGVREAVSTESLMRAGCFNPWTGIQTRTPDFFGSGSSVVTSYMAERICSPEGADPVSFTVTLERKDGTGIPFSGKVYLCDYASGVPLPSTSFDSLVRNHEYRYVISLSRLEFLISFSKWEFGGKVHLEFE